MKFRTFLTFTFVGLVVSSLILSVWSVWSWGSSWTAIFTGAQLTSPMGCDCGVSINYWQHPYLYTLGLVATASLLLFTGWISLALTRSWLKTRSVIKAFAQTDLPVEMQQLFQSLCQQVMPKEWPSLLVPRLLLVQADTPRALSTGFIRPQIFISTATVQQVPLEELRAILTHELMHIKSSDPILLWLVSGLTSVLPLYLRSRIQNRFQEYIECKTDFEAGELVGTAVVGRALLRVASWQPQANLVAAAEMRGSVETRLQVLAGWAERPEVPWKSILATGIWLSALVFGVTLTLQEVDQVYAQEVNSPACLEAESIVYIDDTLVLICPAEPMSVE